jgi:hypothetical protein
VLVDYYAVVLLDNVEDCVEFVPIYDDCWCFLGVENEPHHNGQKQIGCCSDESIGCVHSPILYLVLGGKKNDLAYRKR